MSVVVTGLGAVTAAGETAGATFEGLVGERWREAASEPCDWLGDGELAMPVARVPGFEAGEGSRSSRLAASALREALEDAGVAPGAGRVGLVVGTTTGGMLETERCLVTLADAPEAADREDALARMLDHPISSVTEHLARHVFPFDRSRTLAGACASGALAVLVARTWLELDLVDVAVAGGTDALCLVTLAGFRALGAVAPARCRPFDEGRRGLLLGEGAAFLVLEGAARARTRGARTRAKLLGAAAGAEAHHVTNPEPSGARAGEVIRRALADAGPAAEALAWVNAHGTGTPLNDVMEARALTRALGARATSTPVSSVKGRIGHTLGAAGAVEAAVTVLALERGVLPPTAGLERPDPACAVGLVRGPTQTPAEVALSSSFGFGGMDAALVLGRADVAGDGRAPASARRLVVVGAAATCPAGVLEGAAVRGLRGAEAREALGVDLGALVDGARARRLDRASLLAVIAAEAACRGLAGREGVGLVVGSAFGRVDLTASFVRRLLQRGARFVPPLDFPYLVPSAPAGSASTYGGFTGPVLTVADLAHGGEAAFVQTVELLLAGDVEIACALAVEERSAIVEGSLAAMFARGADVPGTVRSEGAAAVLLASASAAAARGLAPLCDVAWAEVLGPTGLEGAPPPGERRARVLLGRDGRAARARLDASPWRDVPREVLTPHVGAHEAAGAFALALGAADVAAARAGDGSAAEIVLVLAARDDGGYGIVLR